MREEESISVAKGADEVFATVARVEDYGSFSSQYRSTRLLSRDDGRIVLERKARVAGLPMRWISEATVGPKRVTICQTKGPLKGMRTEWRVEPEGQGSKVTITHELRLRFPFQPLEKIVYRLIIRKMAKTILSNVKLHLERPSEDTSQIAEPGGSGT